MIIDSDPIRLRTVAAISLVECPLATESRASLVAAGGRANASRDLARFDKSRRRVNSRAKNKHCQVQTGLFRSGVGQQRHGDARH